MTRTMIDIEELKKNAERFRVAAICASDLTYEWNSKTGRLEWFGDIEKSLGIKNEDLPKDVTEWLNLIHSDDREKIASTVENQINHGGSIYLECRIKHKTRNWAHFRCRGRTIEGDDGKPEKLIGTCTDVTDFKRTEKRLRESETKHRLIYEKSPLGIFHFSKEGVLTTCGVLAGGVAHDFNNLLVAILGNVNVALSEISDSLPVYQQLLAIEEGAKRAADLVNYLLTYAGESRPDRKAVNLNETIESMSTLLESTISKKINLVGFLKKPYSFSSLKEKIRKFF